MAIKWKNFTRNCWVKAVAVILVVASAGVAAWQAAAFTNYVYDKQNLDSILDERMLFTQELPPDYLIDEMCYAVSHLSSQAQFSSKEDIMAGKAVDTDSLAQRIYDKFCNMYYYEYGDDAEYADATIVYPATDGTSALSEETITEMISSLMKTGMLTDSSEISLFRTWLKKNPGVVDACTQEIISEQLEQLSDYSMQTESLENYDYYAFCAETGTTLTNLDAADAAAAKKLLSAASYPLVCFLNTDGTSDWQGQVWDKAGTSDAAFLDYYDCFSGSGNVLLIGLKATAYDSMCAQWAIASRVVQHTAGIITLAALAALLGFVLLCFGAGRKTAEDGIHLIGFDRVWTEAQIVFGVSAWLIWAGIVCVLIDQYASIPENVLYITAIVSSMLLAAAMLGLILAQVRRIKAHKWLDGFLFCRLFKKYIVHSVRWVVQQFGKSPLRQKVVVLAILLPLLCVFWFTVPFIIAGLLYFGMREVDSFEAVTNGAHDIRAGKTGTHIKLDHGSKELHALADDLNGISDGFGDAVDTAVKSERLKAELISNVSHDIKTPLTSIITYIDLLKKCNLTDPTAREYVDVLDQKAQRLRILTGDLFDASKASSGAMKVELMQTDFDALLRQALGERSEHLEKANLDVRIDSNPPVYVNADGRLLWRILDNLLSNCARYALPGSRVYLAIQPGTDFATLTMKNISASELNVSADELMERFTRGDRSRHTEGSGLGLSIAKSLAELMGGSCRVEIDGDLFKAMVTIPVWKEA
ncbi:sensor histidine kinase [Butyricicoccus sp.]|uniref:sensor histidine kinase n=1 Tax=Butyricicoccus sp. TaxID=2049021 RepID=UPI003F1522CC